MRSWTTLHTLHLEMYICTCFNHFEKKQGSIFPQIYKGVIKPTKRQTYAALRAARATPRARENFVRAYARRVRAIHYSVWRVRARVAAHVRRVARARDARARLSSRVP